MGAQFTWLEYSEDHQGAFKKEESHLKELEELGLLNLLPIGRKPLIK